MIAGRPTGKPRVRYMKAVIQTGGKQYLVRDGHELKVEKLDLEEGKSITFEPLMVSDDEGKDPTFGTPVVSGAKVVAKVLEHGRAKKVTVVKYKPKSRYRRHNGHRQPFTKLKIEQITA